jgi:hypothetical protein
VYKVAVLLREKFEFRLRQGFADTVAKRVNLLRPKA